MSMGRQRRTRDELRKSLMTQANGLRDTADEMARMFGGCDDPTHPHTLNLFRDCWDFVDRVARPLIEAEDDEAAEQAAMQLYRQASPTFICASLVIMANRLSGHVVVTDPTEKDWAAY